jgi:hypothetical protein
MSGEGEPGGLLEALLESRDPERGWDRPTHERYTRLLRAERLAAASRPAPTPTSEDRDLAATSAVMAHGLLTSLAAVVGAAETLIEHESRMEPSERRLLLEAILRQGKRLEEVLGGLARGLPIELCASMQLASTGADRAVAGSPRKAREPGATQRDAQTADATS